MSHIFARTSPQPRQNTMLSAGFPFILTLAFQFQRKLNKLIKKKKQKKNHKNKTIIECKQALQFMGTEKAFVSQNFRIVTDHAIYTFREMLENCKSELIHTQEIERIYSSRAKPNSTEKATVHCRYSTSTAVYCKNEKNLFAPNATHMAANEGMKSVEYRAR